MPFNPLCTPSDHRLSRRQWLGSAAAGILGVAGLAQPAFANDLKKKRKQVLFVWLDGGMSQLESWDPKPNTQFGGPFRAIPTSVPGIHVSELLPKHRQADAPSRPASAASAPRTTPTPPASIAFSAAIRRTAASFIRYFGSAVAKLLGTGDSGLPPYVWIKPGNGGFIYKDAGFLGPKYGALAFGDGKPPENLPPQYRP